MEYEGKKFHIAPFSTANTVIKAKFDTSGITEGFSEAFQNQLAKKGMVPHPKAEEAQVVIRGQVVQVDEGNRWVRYFLTFLGGKTVFEVEGEVLVNGISAGALHSVKKSGIGVMGGKSESLLLSNAKSAAADMMRQVLTVLEKA